ncbi:hypothetical protein VPH35_081176 [Triticum aestivum]
MVLRPCSSSVSPRAPCPLPSLLAHRLALLLPNRGRPIKYNYTMLIWEPLLSTSGGHGFAEYPFVLSRPSSPSTTSAPPPGLYQVPLRFVETDKSEDPKYHYSPKGIQIHQVPLPITQTATKCVPLPSNREDSMDIKFLAVTPNIYGNLCD